jgi:hypothetical protein
MKESPRKKKLFILCFYGLADSGAALIESVGSSFSFITLLQQCAGKVGETGRQAVQPA